MKKYYVVDCGKNDEWEIAKFDTKEEAIKEARSHWDHMSDHDKKDTTIEVRDYMADVEAENCDNYDCDILYQWDYSMAGKIEKAVDYMAYVQGENANPEKFDNVDIASLYINDYIEDNYNKVYPEATVIELKDKTIEEWERYINEQLPLYY